MCGAKAQHVLFQSVDASLINPTPKGHLPFGRYLL